MTIYVYSDESGAFDIVHNKFYTFGGLIFTSADEKDLQSRKYIAAERNVRKSEGIPFGTEVKSGLITKNSKRKLYKSVVRAERFGAVISIKKLTYDNLFSNKKTKQRYLDWAYKMAVRRKFEKMIKDGTIDPAKVKSIYFMVDDHSTATDGRYELEESLEKEFKIGIWKFGPMVFHPPLFPSMDLIKVKFCDSATTTLVRAADATANHIFNLAYKCNGCIPEEDKLNIFYHP